MNTKLHATIFYPADGVTTEWDFEFDGVNPDNASGTKPYLYDKNVKVQDISTDALGIENIVDRDVELVSPSRVKVLGAPIAVGHTVKVYRETENRFSLVDYRDRQTVSEADLDLSARQVLFVAMETFDQSTLATEVAGEARQTANEAKILAEQAVVTSDTALVVANAADQKSDRALAVAGEAKQQSTDALLRAEEALLASKAVEVRADEAAESARKAAAAAQVAREDAGHAVDVAEAVDGKAERAVTLAEAAETKAIAAENTANAIDGKATAAVTTANEAKLAAQQAGTTANEAKDIANGINAKADQALTDAATALTAANKATADVSDMQAEVNRNRDDIAALKLVDARQDQELNTVRSRITACEGRLDAIEYTLTPRVPQVFKGGRGGFFAVLDGILYTTNSKGAGAYASSASGRTGQNGLDRMDIVSLPAKVKELHTTGIDAWVLLENKELWVCGSNTTGQLGVGAGAQPVFVQSAVDVDAVFSPQQSEYVIGESRCFIRKGAELFATGHNAYGALGLGDKVARNVWTLVPGLTVSAATRVFNLGGRHGCTFIVQPTQVLVAGYNGYRQLGTPDAADAVTFTDVTLPWSRTASRLPELLTILHGSAHSSTTTPGYTFIVFVYKNTLFACGYGQYGGIGNGESLSVTSPERTPIPGGEVAVEGVLAGGGTGTVFLRCVSGKVLGWGGNVYGLLGQGNVTIVNYPMELPDLAGCDAMWCRHSADATPQANTMLFRIPRPDGSHRLIHSGYATDATDTAGTTPVTNGFTELLLPRFNSDGSPFVVRELAFMMASANRAGQALLDKNGQFIGWGFNGQAQITDDAAVLGGFRRILPPWERHF